MGKWVSASGQDGQAAGRDIHNSHAFVVLAAPSTPREAQLQAEFAQQTGIANCPKAAREWLETLLEQHGFTARELAISWNAKSISWDKEHNKPRVCTPWLEAAFAYLVVSVLGLWCLSMAATSIWASSDLLPARLAAYTLCFVYLGACSLVARFTLWPRRVALRVQAVNKKTERGEP